MRYAIESAVKNGDEIVAHEKITEITRGPGKNLALEGLRGIASLAVVFSHCFYTFFPYLQTGLATDMRAAWESLLLNSPVRVFYNGTFAVSVFFVMSGYVLSRKYFRDYDANALREAAAKRYLRLGIPVFASIMLSFLLMRAHLFPIAKSDLRGFLDSAYQFEASFRAAISDGLFGSLILGHARFNYILWTISIEFLGSLFLFGFLALFGSLRGSGWYALIAAATLIIAIPSDGILYALFLAGAFLHRLTWMASKAASIACFVMAGLYFGGYHWYSSPYLWLVHVAYFFERHGVALQWPLLFPSIGAVLLVLPCVSDNGVSRFLSHRAFVWLGDASFSLYLTHTFVLSSVGVFAYIGSAQLPYQGRAWLVTAIVIALSLVLASAFARLVDAPAVRLATRFGRWSTSHPKEAGASSPRHVP